VNGSAAAGMLMVDEKKFRSTVFVYNRIIYLLYDIATAGILLVLDWFFLQLIIGLLIPGTSIFLVLIPLLLLFLLLNLHYGFFMDIRSRGNLFFELSDGTLVCHLKNGEKKEIRYEQLKGVTLTEIPHRMSMSFFADFASPDLNLVFRLGDLEEEKSLITALGKAGFRKTGSLPVFGRKTFAFNAGQSP
jgi:hypothetical protein